MSDELFIIENVNAALDYYNMGRGMEDGLYPHSPAYWCAGQVANLTDAEREASLSRLDIWDMLYGPVSYIKELCQPGSDVWRYFIVDTSINSTKNDLLVSACAIWGWGLTEDSNSVSCYLAASNLVFAILAQEQYDNEIINDFENLDIKYKRRKAAKARHDNYYGPLKISIRKWAQETINTTSRNITKAALATAADSCYRDWIKENPPATPAYNRLHPLNNNGQRLNEPTYRTIYGWVKTLLDK
ncbi:hypothetical protein [Xenorhabdus griffiniae]|uniref:Phage protein n=1 Tax=Xenorhabdus griffiniae TaxID=351672 RepID=A0ABY9XKL1_9GAMM|nr:hypothetical protein [Xenorhabdus griffiniae]MBD1228587.1 hypothetical protein [Xenorhabdus griffiniae]MBE8588676.1 hypothetical protein [Xenorhabdus griffiniae]WMV73454.1 hypothetical protein QL128_05360 [Xenorhabdus griffiniae]WNH03133.1 hypothetical protein QL112_005365 [Xenorhabdus griffiniae]